MSHLADILDEKGSNVFTIDADASVFEAVQRMVEENIGSLLVTERGKIAGIVTERDYLRRVTLEGRTDRDTAVREIMSTPLIVVTPETTVDECMALMTERPHPAPARRGGGTGRRPRVDRRPREVLGGAARLRDPAPDGLHRDRLSAAPAGRARPEPGLAAGWGGSVPDPAAGRGRVLRWCRQASRRAT